MLYTTLIFTLITILVIGSGLHPILERCEVMAKPEEVELEDASQQQQERSQCCSRFKAYIYNFNANYFAPIFIRVQVAQGN